MAEEGESIDVWGDGKQTRSFLYIDDCIEGTVRLLRSDFMGPVNIGSEEMVSINELANIIIDISSKNISIKNISGPEGVRGRNSDNKLIRKELDWEPKYSLREGLEKTYSWIKSQIDESIESVKIPDISLQALKEKSEKSFKFEGSNQRVVTTSRQ